ncbi:helix-turn-helix domain-containing protein [Kribbella qitaiheensis]|uniref:Helix-turn-helix domain-containing protein n=1 Tax=Kribbella qitaiheensis TaxID=1544730 RepID=A0A7G6WVR5_9ACTN|nr:helix-turn-helix domain-containing protein [Kribbella qitaiheensis]
MPASLEPAMRRRGALSSKNAAAYIDTTEGTLAQWRHRGEGPPFGRIGRKVFYRVEALDAYLRDHEVDQSGGDR